MGYEPGIFREILVTSAKEIYLEIPLKESVNELNEVIIRARTNKEEAMNKMATTGARMLSVEEASRYAGGFDDPARLVSAFAGVAPQRFFQWNFYSWQCPTSVAMETGGCRNS